MAKLFSWLLLSTLALLVGCSQTKDQSFAVANKAVVSPTSLITPNVNPIPAPFESSAQNESEKRPLDFPVDETRLSVNGFTIEKRLRKEWLDFSGPDNDRRNWAEIEYVVVKKGKRVLGKFDAVLAHPLGVRVSFGLFPFLGTKSQQLFISQDTFRDGCQWVVSLSPHFRVIFNGQVLGVGRESYDLQAIDLDQDGVFEIVAPITDFYELHDKIYMAAIPFPDIIFKYYPKKQRYLPANHRFKDHVFKRLVEVPPPGSDSSSSHRAAVLSNLLIHVYAGEKRKAWQVYNEAYKLKDKSEMKRRIKAILKDQAVYKLIYSR